MRSIDKATYLIATTILCIAPANVAIPFQPVLAAPQQALINGPKAAYNTPGFGVELELSTLEYETESTPWDNIGTLVREDLKGKKITPQDFVGGPQTKWQITAELATRNLMAEIIVDGQQNKVDGGEIKTIGEEIVNYMTQWSERCPRDGAKCYANVDGNAGGFNPWIVRWRSLFGPRTYLAPQVTTAMPMEGILQVLQDGKQQNKGNVLINLGADYNKRIIVLTEKSFEKFDRIKPEDINAEFLGFFSLLATYCVAASEGKPEFGPKRGLNIMPRTNFLTMYQIFAEKKLEAQFKQHISLYDIVHAVALQDARDIEKMKFNWQPEDLRNAVDEDWPTKKTNVATGVLTVKEFLDALQGFDSPQLDLLMLMDKMVRHGQIGGFEKKMEGVYGRTEKPAPIFEFRDLDWVISEKLAEKMVQFDRQVVALHGIATKSTLDQIEAGQDSNAKSGHQDQKLKATESTARPPAKQHNCETETEAEKPRQGVTRPKNQSWWLLSFIRHYSGPSNWFSAEL